MALTYVSCFHGQSFSGKVAHHTTNNDCVVRLGSSLQSIGANLNVEMEPIYVCMHTYVCVYVYIGMYVHI